MWGVILVLFFSVEIDHKIINNKCFYIVKLFEEFNYCSLYVNYAGVHITINKLFIIQFFFVVYKGCFDVLGVLFLYRDLIYLSNMCIYNLDRPYRKLRLTNLKYSYNWKTANIYL